MNASSNTWRVGADVGTWRHEVLPTDPTILEDASRRAAWCSQLIEQVLQVVTRAGALSSVSVTTTALGDDAFAGAPGSPEALSTFLRTALDVCKVSMQLSPTCIEPSTHRTFALDAALQLELIADEDAANRPLLSRAHPLNLYVTLRSDLFVEATIHGACDNRVTARANRDALRTLLGELRAIAGVTPRAHESATYPHQIAQDGFLHLGRDFARVERVEPERTITQFARASDRSPLAQLVKLELTASELDLELITLQPRVSPLLVYVLALEHVLSTPEYQPRVAKLERARIRDLSPQTPWEGVVQRA